MVTPMQIGECGNKRCYTISIMSRNVKFQLDTAAANVIITDMAAPIVEQAANAIASRAQSMAGSLSSHPPQISVTTRVGTIKRGVRAIATITAEGSNDHENYVGHIALRKAKDAGRVN